MAFIFQDPTASALNQSLSQVGGAFGQVLQQRGAQRKEEQKKEKYGSILSSALGSLPENPSAIQVTQVLSQALEQGVPQDIVQNYGSLYSVLKKSEPGRPPSPDQVNTMSALFSKFGMPDDVAQRNAELWGQLTTGGQTEMARYLVDQISRSDYSTNNQNPSLGFNQMPEESVVDETEVETFKFPKVNIFQGRTPKEKTSLKTELLKSNTADYKDLSEKMMKTDLEMMRYDQLERLNDSGALPEGLQNLNINWTTGDIRFPKLANPETQQFVKTINDFTVAAKDTFGARVTNFELGAFMKRLPTLANTEGGRRVIIEQMKAMKDLDRLHKDSLKQVYDKYGVQNIDRQNVEKIAAGLREDDEKMLKKRFAESIKAQEVYEARHFAPQGMISVKKPDGTIGFLQMDMADKAKNKGWEIL